MKHRGNKEDDEIFYLILPKWNEVLEDYSNPKYRNPNNPSDGKLFSKALNDACAEYGWTDDEFEEYRRTLRR